MAGNTFGQLFRVMTFGESHGGAVGWVEEGLPAGNVKWESELQGELDRRKPGQSKITTPRKEVYRPSHADYTYEAKYGFRDWRGSGRASARETLARVASGAIAKKYLKQKLGIEMVSFVEQIGDIKADVDFNKVTPKDIESNIVRCPDQ